MDQLAQQPGIRLIFGQPQSGKSRRAVTLTVALDRVLYYDTAGHDYQDGVVCSGLSELRTFWRSHYRGPFRIVFRPEGPTREERRRTRMIDPEFDSVCDMVRTCGAMMFVVDEVDRYADRGEYDDTFTDLLRRGQGHYGVRLIVATQMPQGVGRVLTAVNRAWNIFQTAETAHVGYFTARCGGIDPDDMRRLDRYEYIDYEQGLDSYWICRDDLATGRTIRREREYLYDRAFIGRSAADSGDVVSGSTLADEPKDGPANLPSAQAQADTLDGRSAGRTPGRADPLSPS
jgi:hypothetical protein